MKVTQLLTSAIFVAVSAVIGAPSSRTEGNIAPRSVASGSSQCYFQCPSTLYGEPLAYKDSYNDYFTGKSTHACHYVRPDGMNVACAYNDDGSQDTSTGSDSTCPTQAPSAGCGSSNPNPNTSFKKRSVPKPQTKAERAIQARQYKPKRLAKDE
ncbi:uncharacterized protein L201_006379 [Kwoniella dendrophila CBS 6074]|uniref:Uncharacterized protein n=1 Tax=Kwoniella dendrophila CBS 6074 TaxID=1295534 RepID=A0AAX4K2N3_9TREE